MTGFEESVVALDGLLLQESAGVLRVTFNRPERLNSLSVELIEAVADAVDGASSTGTRVIVLTGAGRGFCSGADVGVDGAPPSLDTLNAANRLAVAITRSPAVVIAAVNGMAAGVGCSIALSSDLVIAKESAVFLLVFTKIGLMPDGGASLLVAAAVGRARAARMALLAEKISAREALDWGLIAKVVPDNSFDGDVELLVSQLAAGAPLALAATKASINAATLHQLDATLGAERDGQTALLESADFREGMAAFQEKRPAQFRGA